MYLFLTVAYILTTKAQNSQVKGHSHALPSFILCSQPAKSFPHVFSKLKITGASRYSSALKHITNCASNDVNPKLVASVCIQIFIPGTLLSNDTSRPSIEGKLATSIPCTSHHSSSKEKECWENSSLLPTQNQVRPEGTRAQGCAYWNTQTKNDPSCILGSGL